MFIKTWLDESAREQNIMTNFYIFLQQKYKVALISDSKQSVGGGKIWKRLITAGNNVKVWDIEKSVVRELVPDDLTLMNFKTRFVLFP